MNDGHLAVLQSGEQGFHGVFVADIAVIQTALQAAQGFQTGAWKRRRPDFCLVIFLELTHDDAAGRVVQHKEYRLVQNAESGGRVWTGGLPEPKKASSGRISGRRMNATRGNQDRGSVPGGLPADLFQSRGCDVSAAADEPAVPCLCILP